MTRIKIAPARLVLDPDATAIVREYCVKEDLSYSDFIRHSLHYLLNHLERYSREDFPTQQEVYGTLGKQPFVVLLSKGEKAAIEALAKDFRLGNTRRSYSRVLRVAVGIAVDHLRKGGKLAQQVVWTDEWLA